LTVLLNQSLRAVLEGRRGNLNLNSGIAFTSFAMTRATGIPMNFRRIKDIAAGRIMMILSIFSISIVFMIGIGLFYRSWPILSSKPVSQLIFSSVWKPHKGLFGFWPYIMGTVWVTVVALIIAVPLCLLTAIFLSEYAPRRLREMLLPLIDLLSGVPSVVFGVWGVLLVVPLIDQYIAPLFGVTSGGYCILAGGIVLAIMVFPVIIHVTMEVFKSVPSEMRTAALSLGATRWQMIKGVLLRKSLPGIVAALVLGFSRAMGETMAVLMVVGNRADVPTSIFQPAYPLPALIANNYGEMMSIPLYDSALLLAAFILLVLVLIFNIIARIILIHVEKLAE
jgi:phosphate transport system permease protein